MKSPTSATFGRVSPFKNQYENQVWSSNQVLCGVDEVGRGCLAGPLVTAAVILPISTHYEMLRDSKSMTEPQRLEAYSWIVDHACWATGWVHHRIIDTYGIERATAIAMKKAIMHVAAVSSRVPAAFVIDAVKLSLQDTSYAGIPIYSFYKAESLSFSVAAASIVAKVTRDKLMHTFNCIFPHYHFDKHKGYGTQQHCGALARMQTSLMHRKNVQISAF